MKFPIRNLTRWELCWILLPLTVAASALSFIAGRMSVFGRWFLFVLAILLPCGCQQRETHLALQQSDQAAEGAQAIVAERIAPLVAGLPPEIHAAITAALDDVTLLMVSARESLRPALALTAGNEPPPETRTTVRQAVEYPHEFVRAAAVQTGRAHVEVEGYLRWVGVASFAVRWGTALAGDLASQLLLGLGGSGLIAGLLGKGVQLWRTAKTATTQAGDLKRALTDAVAFGTDMEAAETDAQAEQVKDRHKVLQANSGTRPLITQALGVKK